MFIAGPYQPKFSAAANSEPMEAPISKAMSLLQVCAISTSEGYEVP